MALPLTGQLGTAALGSLQLGAAPVYGEFVPHRGRPRGSISAASVRGTMARGGTARSSIRISTPRSEVTNG